MKKDETSPQTAKKGGVGRFFKRLFLSVLIIFVLLASIIAGAILGFVDNSTDLIAQEYNLDFTSMLYYIDKETNTPVELDMVYSEENRIWVDMENIPQNLRNAFVSIEDERFDKHGGVDLKRTIGATITWILKGDSSYGGSTITQQLIKNVTGDNERSPIRKIQEMVRAINLERKLTKDEIIEMYMNTIYLGEGCNGVQSASNVYFNKDVSKLSLAECASIAGITQYPSKYDPLINFEEHKKKQEIVLDKMYELGYITLDECTEAKNAELKLVKGTAETGNNKIQSYFIDQVISDVLRDLKEKKKMSDEDASRLLFKGGLKIYTTIDPDIQSAMEQVFENNANFPGASGENGPQSAMMVIDPYTGQIKGVVGGRGKKSGNRVLNRASDTLRQPGSSIKPVSTYAPAIENGIITPATIVDDSEIKIGDWEPKNSDDKFMGKITVRKALEMSRNIPVVKILDKLTVDKSFDFLTKKVNITSLVESQQGDDGHVYSDKFFSCLGLGGLTYGVSLKEMTASYCPFVNGGIYVSPISYTKVINSSGKVILENKLEPTKAMSPETAYTMANMLTGVISSGTGTGARLANSEIMAGGKTGTTTNDVDRWFVGFTPNYVGAVWFGYDMPKAMTGLGNPCVTLWKKVMDSIHKGIEIKTIKAPEVMVEKNICQVSGKLAAKHCSNVKKEYFKAGTQPSAYCTSHSYSSIKSELDGKFKNKQGSKTKNAIPGNGQGGTQYESDKNKSQSSSSAAATATPSPHTEAPPPPVSEPQPNNTQTESEPQSEDFWYSGME